MPKTIKDLVKNLPRLPDTDAVRRKGNSYALNAEGQICALSLSESGVENILLDESAVALEHLYLNDNKPLREVRFAVPLPRLRRLYLSRCALAALDLPDGCGTLEQVYVQGNQLGSLVFQGDCPKLELLDASNNQLKEFNLREGFEKLAYLYLNDNLIETLNFPEKLPVLNIIQLDNNRLRYLSDYLKDWIVQPDTVLDALYLGGNAPKDIPKVFLGDGGTYSKKSCLEDARIWFRELKDFPSEQNKVVKLMLTGNGNAGKSTLLCALKNGACPHDHTTTHGIQIETVEKTGIDYNVWDFGGQEVYHGTHRLFMESEALQIILFDPETEELARNGKRVRDRANEEQVMHHEVVYWYMTTKDLSPGSRFVFVQNKKDKVPEEDSAISQYAKELGAKFLHLAAKTGENMDKLEISFKNEAWNLPDFEMLMPLSWLKVRQFFIDNAKNEATSEKLIDEDQFFQLCKEKGVSEKSAPLLLEYLHHNGFLYRHPNLKGQIIADQRWALKAIYKPLDREAEHYREFRNYNGKIRVDRLFQVFGDYTDDYKWLFLNFMESCGLCFHLNNKPWQENRDESDVYVFPEFLAPDKPRIVADLWKRAVDVQLLRYKMPWINYIVIQSFIVALGRKTDTENIWRNGIHIQTDEGCFKVELDCDQKALLLYIEKNAMSQWLKPIFEALQTKRDSGIWEVAGPDGHFHTFDFEKWQQQQKERVEENQIVRGSEGENKTISQRLEDVPQQLDRQVILFLSASPAARKVSCGQEFAHLYEELQENKEKGICELKLKLNITSDEMSKVIRDYVPTIVHFCGHGEEINPDAPREKGLLFISDDHTGTKVMDAQMLDKIFALIKKRNPALNVVFLNACYSEPQAAAISKHDIYTIGANSTIGSVAARKFAAGFYGEYFLRKDIESSVSFGIEKALTENIDIDDLVHLFYQGNKI